MASKLKRVRTKNFTEQDKHLLIKLIMPFKNVIENIKVSTYLFHQCTVYHLTQY